MYYPDQRYAASYTIIRRDCVLPDEAIGSVRVANGKRVDIRDIVANGVIPSRYAILDGMKFFRLRKPEALEDLMQVETNDIVEKGEVLAGKKPNRGKRLFAPSKGIVVAVADGRIIFQEMPQVIDLEAGLRGRVIQVMPDRGVKLEAVGALAQGVWGSGHRMIATLRLSPEGGLQDMSSDSLAMRMAGYVVVTRKTLMAKDLRIAQETELAGIIAPSMQSNLVDMVHESNLAVMLTEGFGDIPMNTSLYTLLEGFEGQQIMMDAHKPGRWELRAPAIIVNVRAGEDEKPSRPNVMLSLRAGMTVRVTRNPYSGLTGRVIDLPKLPILLDNGLRIPCARVELIIGETVFVPLINLEVMGR